MASVLWRGSSWTTVVALTLSLSIVLQDATGLPQEHRSFQFDEGQMSEGSDVNAGYSECYGNSTELRQDRRAVADLILQRTAGPGMVSIPPGECLEGRANNTLARLCNQDLWSSEIRQEDFGNMYQNLLRDCGSSHGQRKENGLFWETRDIRDGDIIIHSDLLSEDANNDTKTKRGKKQKAKPQEYHASRIDPVPCDPADQSNYGIWRTDCAKPLGHQLDPTSGDCPQPKKDKPWVGWPCVTYCEEKRRYNFGPEQPYAQTSQASCSRGAESCAWADGLSFAIGKTWNPIMPMKTPTFPAGKLTGAGKGMKAFGDFTKSFQKLWAVSLGVSQTVTETISQTKTDTYDGNPDYCGYWTFIPRVVETCGTMSVYASEDLHWSPPPKGHKLKESKMKCISQDMEPPISYKDQCAWQPIIGVDGRPLGYNILVWYDCDTKIRAPDSEQNPLYLIPGVASREFTPSDPPGSMPSPPPLLTSPNAKE